MTYYQLDIREVFVLGNDLETVLLTSICIVLHASNNSSTKVKIIILLSQAKD